MAKNSPTRAERSRLNTLLAFEKGAREQGFSRVAGLDEAGRGPLAGPVVAAACIIPDGVFISGVDDSKKLSPEKRAEIYDQLIAHPDIQYGVGIVSAEIIDKINIHQAVIKAMMEALLQLPSAPDYLLVDGLRFPHPTIPAQKIIRGDALSYSIGAASILAKVTRDHLMVQYHEQYPQYGFHLHKGYGTEMHLENLFKHGPCPIHRTSFAPVREALSPPKEAQLTFL